MTSEKEMDEAFDMWVVVFSQSPKAEDINVD
jgi:hypothetical protein